MKKFLLVLAITVSAIAVNAQVTFGLKAGLNIATLGGKDWDDVDGKKSNTGFNAAGLVNIPISSNLAFVPEVQFSANQGLEFREAPFEFNFNLTYINIPLMLQYLKSGFFAEVGPQIGFLMAAKIKITDGTTTDEEDVKEDLKGTDVGVNLGLGYVTNSGFGFGGRYTFGMSNIVDDPDGETKNRVFAIYLKWIFKKATGK